MNCLYRHLKEWRLARGAIYLTAFCSTIVFAQTEVPAPETRSYATINLKKSYRKFIAADKYLWAMRSGEGDDVIDIYDLQQAWPANTIELKGKNMNWNMVHLGETGVGLIKRKEDNKKGRDVNGDKVIHQRTEFRGIDLYEASGEIIEENGVDTRMISNSLLMPKIESFLYFLNVDGINWSVYRDKFNIALLDASEMRTTNLRAVIDATNVTKIVKFDKEIWGNAFAQLVSFSPEDVPDEMAKELSGNTRNDLVKNTYEIRQNADTGAFQLSVARKGSTPPGTPYLIEDFASSSTSYALWMLVRPASQQYGPFAYTLLKLNARDLDGHMDETPIALERILLMNEVKNGEKVYANSQGYGLGLWLVDKSMVLGMADKPSFGTQKLFMFTP